MNEEIWKEIPILPGYQASNFGRIRSPGRIRKHSWAGTEFFQNGRVLTPTKTTDGYMAIAYKPEGCDHFRFARVHRLLASAFIPNPHNKEQVNHKDGNRLNNLLSNLEWATPLENTRHAIDVLGKHGRGEQNSFAKLTAWQVDEIRLLRFYGAVYRDIAEAYGITRRYVGAICMGQTWQR